MAISFDTITNFFLPSALLKLANNFVKTEEEFEKVIYKDGSQEMLSELDMNGFRVINNGAPVDDNDLATLAQVKEYTANVTAGPAGPSNNTRLTLAALKAANITDKTSLYDTSVWTWTLGDYTGLNDDINVVKADSTAISVGAWVRQTSGKVPFTQSGTGSIVTDAQTELKRQVWAERFGLSTGNSASANSTAILNAVASLRSNPTVITTDGLNGGSFTVYSSGELLIGNGQFNIAPDTLKFFQDLGLVIKGRGSRKTNNYLKGRTILNVVGNGEYGIQVYGNGARGLVLEDLDIVYNDNTFTGDVLDNFGSPGMVVNRCHIGTNGITGGTRYQTARSLLRLTYDEFVHCVDTTFDGSVDMIWCDDVRQPPIGPPNEFGGSASLFSSCVFYDCTGNIFRQDGNRNRKKFSVRDCVLNPISVDCSRGVNMTNVDGLQLNLYCTPSTSHKATNGWVNIVNCTGSMKDGVFLGQCAAGSVSGNFDVSNNFFGSDSGLTIAGGNVTGSGNEFSQGSVATPSGFIISPTIPLTVRLGPDTFKTGMGRSYDIPADSANLDGYIIYSATQDSSTSRFRNTSARVAIDSNDQKGFAISASTYTVLPTDTGRIIDLTGATPTVTLPAASTTLGCKFGIMSNTTQVVVIQGPSGSLYLGAGGAKTSMTSGGDAGIFVMIENRRGVYNVTQKVGNFTYA